jgi:hypothetical protein
VSAAVDHDAELCASEQIIRDELSIWPLDLKRILLASLLVECERDAQPPLRPLTSQQRRVLEVICHHLDTHGMPPTLREIGDAIGIRSTHGVACHLELIEKEGLHHAHALRVARPSRASEAVVSARAKMTPEAFAARDALIRERHAAYLRKQKRTDDYATHILNRPGREHGTEFVEWASEIEGARVPEIVE